MIRKNDRAKEKERQKNEQQKRKKKITEETTKLLILLFIQHFISFGNEVEEYFGYIVYILQVYLHTQLHCIS